MQRRAGWKIEVVADCAATLHPPQFLDRTTIGKPDDVDSGHGLPVHQSTAVEPSLGGNRVTVPHADHELSAPCGQSRRTGCGRRQLGRHVGVLHAAYERQLRSGRGWQPPRRFDGRADAVALGSGAHWPGPSKLEP